MVAPLSFTSCTVIESIRRLGVTLSWMTAELRPDEE